MVLSASDYILRALGSHRKFLRDRGGILDNRLGADGQKAGHVGNSQGPLYSLLMVITTY